MPQAYVIMETAWEYNDDFYYTAEGDPGFAQRVFLNPATAQTYCEEKERAAWRRLLLDPNSEEDLSEYVGNGGTILDYTHLEPDEFVAQLQAAGLIYDPDDNEFTFPERPFQEWEVDQIRGAISGIGFFSVAAVELED